MHEILFTLNICGGSFTFFYCKVQHFKLTGHPLVEIDSNQGPPYISFSHSIFNDIAENSVSSGKAALFDTSEGEPANIELRSCSVVKCCSTSGNAGAISFTGSGTRDVYFGYGGIDETPLTFQGCTGAEGKASCVSLVFSSSDHSGSCDMHFLDVPSINPLHMLFRREQKRRSKEYPDQRFFFLCPDECGC